MDIVKICMCRAYTATLHKHRFLGGYVPHIMTAKAYLFRTECSHPQAVCAGNHAMCFPSGQYISSMLVLVE
jgi:hypothetical protein